MSPVLVVRRAPCSRLLAPGESDRPSLQDCPVDLFLHVCSFLDTLCDICALRAASTSVLALCRALTSVTIQRAEWRVRIYDDSGRLDYARAERHRLLRFLGVFPQLKQVRLAENEVETLWLDHRFTMKVNQSVRDALALYPHHADDMAWLPPTLEVLPPFQLDGNKAYLARLAAHPGALARARQLRNVLFTFRVQDINDDDVAQVVDAFPGLSYVGFFGSAPLLTSAMYPALATLKEIECLHLGSAGAHPPGGLVAFLRSAGDIWPRMSSLVLYGTLVSDDVVKEVTGRIGSLTSLTVTSASALSDDGVAHLVGLPQLHSLDVSWCSNLTEVSAEHISKISTLTELNLENCDWMTLHALDQISNIAGMTRLNISFCRALAGPDVARALGKLSNLTALDVQSKITDDIAAGFLSTLTKLRELRLGYAGIGDGLLKQIGTYPLKDTLEDVELGPMLGEDNFTEAGAEALRQMTRLRKFSCPQLPTIEPLTKIHTLEKLEHWLCEDDLPHLAQMANLREIVDGAGAITDDNLEKLAPLKKLEKIESKGLNLDETKLRLYLEAADKVRILHSF